MVLVPIHWSIFSSPTFLSFVLQSTSTCICSCMPTFQMHPRVSHRLQEKQSPQPNFSTSTQPFDLRYFSSKDPQLRDIFVCGHMTNSDLDSHYTVSYTIHPLRHLHPRVSQTHNGLLIVLYSVRSVPTPAAQNMSCMRARLRIDRSMFRAILRISKHEMKHQAPTFMNERNIYYLLHCDACYISVTVCTEGFWTTPRPASCKAAADSHAPVQGHVSTCMYAVTVSLLPSSSRYH